MKKTQGGILLQHGRGHVASNPVTHPAELADLLERETGAEGFTIQNGRIIALRFDADGNALAVDQFQIEGVK